MSELSLGGVNRGEDDMIQSMVSEDGDEDDNFSGPFGLWEFPLLNAIASNISDSSSGRESSDLVVTEIHRDEDGRIEAIEEVRK